MIISPKDNVMSIMEPYLNKQEAPEDGADLIARIEGVSKILQEHPELKNDNELYGSLLSATENSDLFVVDQFRKNLINDHCLYTNNKTGVLKCSCFYFAF